MSVIMKPVLMARKTLHGNGIYTKIVYPDFIIRYSQSLPFISLNHNMVVWNSTYQFHQTVLVTAVNTIESFVGTDYGLVNSRMPEVALTTKLIYRLANACYNKCIAVGTNWTIVDDTWEADKLLWQLFEAINDELFFATGCRNLR